MKSPNSRARRQMSFLYIDSVSSRVSAFSVGLSCIDPFTTVMCGASRLRQISRRIQPVFEVSGVMANHCGPPVSIRRVIHSSKWFRGGGSSYPTKFRLAPPSVAASWR